MTLLFVLLVVVLAIILISVIYSRQRETRLKGYPGLTRAEFIAHFSLQMIPRRISETVYETFRRKASLIDFKPSPEMSIEDVFEQAGEDTDDDARKILKELCLPEPDMETLELWEGSAVKTISDLVLWIDWVRRQSSEAGSGA